MDNKKIILALKNIDSQEWSNGIKSSDINEIAASINLNFACNSGFYTPRAIQIKELDGIYFLHQDNSLIFEFRAIQIGDIFIRQQLTEKGYNQFEAAYFSL